MSLLSPWALAWAAAAAAIVGLYFLKPRSRRVEVSSIWLWQGALREESARTLIQWLKRHLLLLLQVVVALLAMFALARPALTREQPVGRTVVLGMDVSAAMLANDGDPAAPGLVPGPNAGTPPGAPAGVERAPASDPGRGGNSRFTRLDEARARAVAFLRGPEFRPGDRVIVLGMADRAEVVAQGTLPADLGRLQQALERLGPLPAELDLPQALEVASGLTSSARVGQLVIFSGGVLDPARLTPSPELNVSVVPVGKGEADNQAVTALAARRTATGDLEVFVRVRNFGDQPVQGTLQLLVDGQPAQPQPVSLPPQGSQP
ncbi:MAG TPA: VWA domain-containing protein, partial [Chloroflexota bacterium]|nr:VWA domain-containing protein [Chloroflexota bacterium]